MFNRTGSRVMAKNKTAMLAMIEPALAKMLKRKLVTDEMTFRAWLESRILEYVGKIQSPYPQEERSDGKAKEQN